MKNLSRQCKLFRILMAFFIFYSKKLKQSKNYGEDEISSQKAQMKTIIEQYKRQEFTLYSLNEFNFLSFIAKLLNDKKELSINCEKLSKENSLLINETKRTYSENDVDVIKLYESKNSEEREKFLKEIDSLNIKVKNYKKNHFFKI